MQAFWIAGASIVRWGFVSRSGRTIRIYRLVVVL